MSATQMMSKQTMTGNIITNLFYFRIPCERTVGTGDSAVYYLEKVVHHQHLFDLQCGSTSTPVQRPLPLLPPMTSPLPPPITRPLPLPLPVSAPSATSRRRTGTTQRTGTTTNSSVMELPQCNYSLLILEGDHETHRQRDIVRHTDKRYIVRHIEKGRHSETHRERKT